MALQAVSEAQPVWIQEVLNSYATDPKAQKLLISLAVHSPNAQGYVLDKGLIKLIAAFHASAIGGHSGVQATYYRLKQLFCWKRHEI